jgi:hypothetical protein
MGWQDFLMKHGIGSPGYIAKTMARQYRAIKEAQPSLDERSVLFRLYANRVAAQSILGGPAEYRMSRENPSLMRAAVEQSANLFSIIRHVVFIEHPELHNPHAPSNRFEVLDRVLAEVLDREIPDWRKTSQQRQVSPDEREHSSHLQRQLNPKTADACAPSAPRFQEGLSVETALNLFLAACKEPGPGTLFITDRWIRPRLQSLRARLSEPITTEQAAALCDAVAKRAELDDVIEWLSDSTLSWQVFHHHKRQSEAELKRIKGEEQKLEYERKLAESEMAWKTKANTHWEATMRDKDFQAKRDPSAAKQKYGHLARPCPKCGSGEVTWFYYVTPLPRYEERHFHGSGGWMTACERCSVEIDFFDEVRVYY